MPPNHDLGRGKHADDCCDWVSAFSIPGSSLEELYSPKDNRFGYMVVVLLIVQ